MHDQPDATEDEQDQAPERLSEEEAKSAPGHENPEPVEPEDRG